MRTTAFTSPSKLCSSGLTARRPTACPSSTSGGCPSRGHGIRIRELVAGGGRFAGGSTTLRPGGRTPRCTGLRLHEPRLVPDELADGFGGHDGPIALPNLLPEPIGRLSVGGIIQHILDG